MKYFYIISLLVFITIGCRKNNNGCDNCDNPDLIIRGHAFDTLTNDLIKNANIYIRSGNNTKPDFTSTSQIKSDENGYFTIEMTSDKKTSPIYPVQYIYAYNGLNYGYKEIKQSKGEVILDVYCKSVSYVNLLIDNDTTKNVPLSCFYGLIQKGNCINHSSSLYQDTNHIWEVFPDKNFEYASYPYDIWQSVFINSGDTVDIDIKY